MEELLRSTATASSIMSSTITGVITATATATPAPSPIEPIKNWSSLIGIVTAIVGNVLIAIALNVQRYAHTRLHKERLSIRRRARAATKRARQSGNYGTVEQNGSGRGDGNGATISDDDGTPDYHQETDPLNASFQSGGDGDADSEDVEGQSKAATNYLKSPYWWLGQILITLGEMGNFLAYGFAPASIVSPLGVVALVSNCLIAPLVFHETFRGRDFWGVLVAVGGVVTVVLSANTQENKLNPHDVWGAITTLEFEIYLGVTVALIIVLMWASPRYGKNTILIDLGLVGLFGGYTALSTKGVSSMLSSTLWRAFATPVTYVLVFILLGTAIMQIRYVNKSLQRFDSTQVIPIQFVMFTLCVILGSAVLYRDFEETTAEQAGKFVGGCLLTFFGVFLITSGRESHNLDEDGLSDDEDFEETIGLEDQDGDQGNVKSRTGSVAQSRRSSRHSRVNFPESGRSQPPDEREVPTFNFTGHGTTPSSLGPESASLLGNWSEAPTPSTPPGRGIRTYSADTLMRGSAVLSPSRSHPVTPLADGRRMPARYPTDQPMTPQGRANTYCPSQHHRSGTFISPSPLASTVTTVMKDGFLRGDKRKQLARKSSMQHFRSRMRASLFFNEGGNGRVQGVPNSEPNLAAGIQGEGSEYHDIATPGLDDESRTRSRRFSDTLGGFFKPKTKLRKDQAGTDLEHGEDSDDGPGPSN